MQSNPFSLIAADWPQALSQQAHLRCLEALFDETYEYYRVPLPAHVRKMYAQDMLDFGYAGPQSFGDVKWAIETWRRTPAPSRQTKKPPLPQDLIAILVPKPQPQDEANQIAAAIWGAISRVGYNKPMDVLRAQIGDKAMEVVRLRGNNWPEICRAAQASDAGIWLAQMRDLAMTVIDAWEHKHKEGLLDAHRQRQGAIADVGANLSRVQLMVQSIADKCTVTDAR